MVFAQMPQAEQAGQAGPTDSTGSTSVDLYYRDHSWHWTDSHQLPENDPTSFYLRPFVR
jgi:hypothetical protein